MKKQIYILMLLSLTAASIFSCKGNNTTKRDTTTTMGGDASNKDTLLDKGKPADTDKMDTGKEKASMHKK